MNEKIYEFYVEITTSGNVFVKADTEEEAKDYLKNYLLPIEIEEAIDREKQTDVYVNHCDSYLANDNEIAMYTCLDVKDTEY